MQRQVHLERLSSDIGVVIGVLHVTLCLCIVFEMHSGVGQPHSFHADCRATKYPCEDGERNISSQQNQLSIKNTLLVIALGG